MKFLLQNIEVEVFLGVPDEERAQKQNILVSISFDAEMQKAEKTDDIEDTVNYFEMYEFIKNFPGETEFYLLERLYRELLDGLKKAFPSAQNMELTIQKFPFEDASVVIGE